MNPEPENQDQDDDENWAGKGFTEKYKGDDDED